MIFKINKLFLSNLEILRNVILDVNNFNDIISKLYIYNNDICKKLISNMTIKLGYPGFVNNSLNYKLYLKKNTAFIVDFKKEKFQDFFSIYNNIYYYEPNRNDLIILQINIINKTYYIIFKNISQIKIQHQNVVEFLDLLSKLIINYTKNPKDILVPLNSKENNFYNYYNRFKEIISSILLFIFYKYNLLYKLYSIYLNNKLNSIEKKLFKYQIQNINIKAEKEFKNKHYNLNADIVVVQQSIKSQFTPEMLEQKLFEKYGGKSNKKYQLYISIKNKYFIIYNNKKIYLKLSNILVKTNKLFVKVNENKNLLKVHWN